MAPATWEAIWASSAVRDAEPTDAGAESGVVPDVGGEKAGRLALRFMPVEKAERENRQCAVHGWPAKIVGLHPNSPLFFIPHCCLRRAKIAERDKAMRAQSRLKRSPTRKNSLSR